MKHQPEVTRTSAAVLEAPSILPDSAMRDYYGRADSQLSMYSTASTASYTHSDALSSARTSNPPSFSDDDDDEPYAYGTPSAKIQPLAIRPQIPAGQQLRTQPPSAAHGLSGLGGLPNSGRPDYHQALPSAFIFRGAFSTLSDESGSDEGSEEDQDETFVFEWPDHSEQSEADEGFDDYPQHEYPYQDAPGAPLCEADQLDIDWETDHLWPARKTPAPSPGTTRRSSVRSDLEIRAGYLRKLNVGHGTVTPPTPATPPTAPKPLRRVSRVFRDLNKLASRVPRVQSMPQLASSYDDELLREDSLRRYSESAITVPIIREDVFFQE